MTGFLRAAAALGLVLFPVVRVLADYTFTPIDYPNVSYSATFGNSNAGPVSGEYRDAFGSYHAYILSNGSFESFDYPGSIGTSALDVNSAGDSVGIFGEYFTGYTKAFRRVAGNISELVPASGSTYTQAGGMNDAGHIVGSYYVNNLDRGFIFNGTTYTIGLNAPGARHTVPCGINTSDSIVGDYTTAAGVTHGFLRVGSSYTTIDYPNATFTRANDINDSGQIAGFYHDADGATHGFIRSSGGVYTSVDPPGSTMTQIRGINNSGQLSGYYNDTNGISHGFIATLNADFNGDGAVDAADYVVWRKRNGTLDEYNFWRSKFGTAGSSGMSRSDGDLASVPEPAIRQTVPLGVCGLLGFVCPIRGRRRRSVVPSRAGSQ
jgi:hypothetical protein